MNKPSENLFQKKGITMITKNNSLTTIKSLPWFLFALFLMIAFAIPDLEAKQEVVSIIKESGQDKVYHSSDFGWKANQEVSEEFSKLLESGMLKAGVELVLDHTYRINGNVLDEPASPIQPGQRGVSFEYGPQVLK